MKRLDLKSPGNIELHDVPLPETGDSDVLIQVRACGIDRHATALYAGVNPDNGAVPVFGKAGAGIVTATGVAVGSINTGDRVVFWDADTVYSEYCSVPVSSVLPLPDPIGFAEGAMAHLFPDIIRGIEQGGLSDQNVFISGADPSGMLCAQLSRAYGAKHIIMTDLFDQRLKRALHLVADVAINASTEDVVRRVQEETQDLGIDVCLECTGETSGFRHGEALLRAGGRMVVIGRHQEPVSINMADWADRSLTLIMGKEQPDETRDLIEKGLQMVEMGAIELRPLLTHVFPFHRATEAFELITSDPGRTITVALQP